MADTSGGGVQAPWPALFTPEERLGWRYTDRQRLRAAFGEPEPVFDAATPETSTQETSVDERLLTRLSWAWKAAAGGAVLGLAALIRRSTHTGAGLSPAQVAVVAGGAAAALAAAWCLLVFAHRRAVHSIWDGRRGRDLTAAVDAAAAWSKRMAAHEDRELQRLASIPQWQPVLVKPGARRVDVIGGSLWGWEAFLTVFGSAAMVARGPILVVDLSGEAVVRELARGALETGLSVDVQVLPADLADSDLITGLDPGEITQAFVESLHGGDTPAGRAERATDDRILTEICQALAAGGITMARIAAAARVMLGEPARDQVLTPAERTLLIDELFSEAYRTQSAHALRRIEALAYPLGPLGSRDQPRPAADLRCVATATTWRSGGIDFLADLIIAMTGRQAAAATGAPATIVVAGADELAVRHIERLSDLCDRRGIRLVLMFRHLRETSTRVLGAGPVVFMKLGNHEEAARAADFIGREHRFVVSQLTHSVGGDSSHALADSSGQSEGTGHSSMRDRGASTNSWLAGRSNNWGQSETESWNTERNWGHTSTVAESAHWSTTTSNQLAYEHAVEPRTLQQLPDYAMLLVEHTPTGTAVQTVEINPEIPLLAHTEDSWHPAAVAGIPTDAIPAHDRSPLTSRAQAIEPDHLSEQAATARSGRRPDRRRR